MSAIEKLYGQAPALLTDLYQLTMAYAHWHNGTGQRDAVFHLFFRSAPYANGFAIAAGIQTATAFASCGRKARTATPAAPAAGV